MTTGQADLSVQEKPDTQSVTVYQHEIPDFAAQQLARLYGNVYSSVPHWRNCGELDDAVHTYVARRGDEVTALLLYRCDGREARVMNEGILIDDEMLERFTSYLFSAHPDLNVVTFHAVSSNIRRLSRPCQRFNCLEDIVLALPASPEDYLARMGSSTRSYIKRYLNKLKRDFPTFSQEIYWGQDISEQHVREIVELNRARMLSKGRTQGIDSAEFQRILHLARDCGMVSIVRIGGRICAGTINYRVGDNYFLDVIAHDPAYNEYRLGTLGCYLTICECIARGGKEYHFLWGQHDYKFRLLGVQRDLDHVCIYRSRFALLRHGATVLRNLQRDYMRRVELWLRNGQKENRLIARLGIAAVRSVRTVRLAR